ncbi:hypothetical protein CMI37_06730 [Candidatus Pacearchaeota archaeon]|nr:hypothetical protein [Candidatus Pacearchaeota archaeon]
MAVTKIDPSEIPEKRQFWGRPVSEETLAIRALQPGEAIKFPCRWKHHHGNCSGYVAAYSTAAKAGFKLTGRCRDGVVYVMRLPETS